MVAPLRDAWHEAARGAVTGGSVVGVGQALCSPVPTTVAPPAHWQREWELALESLELDVTAAEDLLRALHAQTDLPDGAEVMRSRWDPTSRGPRPDPATSRRARPHAPAATARGGRAARRRGAQQPRPTYGSRTRLTETGSAAPVYVDVAL